MGFNSYVLNYANQPPSASGKIHNLLPASCRSSISRAFQEVSSAERRRQHVDSRNSRFTILQKGCPVWLGTAFIVNAAMDDMALLREYAARNSEAARALVSRRVNFVYSRRCGSARPASGEEITQRVHLLAQNRAISGKPFSPAGCSKPRACGVSGNETTPDAARQQHLLHLFDMRLNTAPITHSSRYRAQPPDVSRRWAYASAIAQRGEDCQQTARSAWRRSAPAPCARKSADLCNRPVISATGSSASATCPFSSDPHAMAR